MASFVIVWLPQRRLAKKRLLITSTKIGHVQREDCKQMQGNSKILIGLPDKFAWELAGHSTQSIVPHQRSM